MKTAADPDTTLTPIVYQPAVVTTSTEPAESVWIERERLEYAEPDMTAAMHVDRTLARSPDRTVRAGALICLARTFKRAGRMDEALSTYTART